MDFIELLEQSHFLWTPTAFAMLTTASTVFVWLALRPASSVRTIRNRLDGYLVSNDVVEAMEMDAPFRKRVFAPLLRRLLRLLGNFVPARNIEKKARMLVEAGHPGGLTVLDFLGLQLLLLLLVGGACFFLTVQTASLAVVLRNSSLLGAISFFLPTVWLHHRVRKRKQELLRALPDALDMMTIGVEAGLAFESAMLKVGDRWNNALTRELRRTVGEMRVGTSRELALERMAERLGVAEISTFVTVLIQSNQLGMSVARVLHTQADEMRTKRRQRAEEMARKAGGKMVFPLVFFFMPALFTVILGPALPDLVAFFLSIRDGY